MKHLIIPSLILLVTFSACAQSASHLDAFYKQYKNDSGDSFDPNFLFTASFSHNDGNTKDEKNWLHKITYIRCILIDGKKTPNADQEWADLSHALRADHFEEWFSAHKGKGRLQLLSLDGKGDLEDIACVLVGDDGGGLFFHLRGHFTAADRSSMQEALQSHDGE